ncbi:MAG: 23S rRNA (guanosine(2251)-2'-O)-methyltransferase RlmB [Chloroflexaceae bacterium]|nr:23S rRNA (guanosine(2251)-2'-O)-methyltransferase RlmB [Chloroflexaceae bacterium]
MTDWLYGRNAVQESLRAGRRTFRRLVVSSGAREAGPIASILALAEQRRVVVERVAPRVLDEALPGTRHQGVALEAGPYPYADLATCLEAAARRSEPALLVMLDHVQDPQNVGTLLRTAETVGVHGVILPHRRAVEVTPAVVNASSGATEHLAIAMVGNLDQAIRTLQEGGVWVVGVEQDERARPFDQADLTMPLALVVGAEGSGLARLTRERCDFLVALPMRGLIASLNVAVAGSIVLYAAWRQRDSGHSSGHSGHSGHSGKGTRS